MTTVKFLQSGEMLKGFEVSGHSDDTAEDGEDIICSAISSATYLVANTITDVIGKEAQIKIDDGYFYFETQASSDVQPILKGLKLHLISLSQDYPKNIYVKNI